MARGDEIIKERLKKVEELKKIGVNPYAYKFDKKDNAADLQESYKKLKKEDKEMLLLLLSGESKEIAKRAREIKSKKVKTLKREEIFKNVL